MNRMNLGSGRDYREGWINVDIKGRFDVFLDIGKPIDGDRYDLGIFDEIDAIEVLEHVHDLPQAWANCLALLKEGGIMRVVVPHELSQGGWCDPTHVRGFNPKSFLYVDSWSWYLGWHRATPAFKLKVETLDLVLAKGVIAEGADSVVLERTPGAVEQIHVTLRKVRMSDEEVAAGRVAAGDVL